MVINGKDYKYITYRESRGVYQVKVQGKTKTCRSLAEAIEARRGLLKMARLSSDLITDVKAVYTPPKVVIPLLAAGFTDWLRRYKRPTVEFNTYSCYRNAAKLFFPYIGNLPVDKVTYTIIQDVALAQQERKRRSKYLSADYVRSCVNKLSVYFDWLVQTNVLKINPCRVGKLQLHVTDKAERRAITRKEQQKFLLAAKEYDYNWYLMFFVYFQTGARRGEIASLRYEDIDYKHKLITVHTTAKEGYSGQEVGSTKTKTSRTIPVSDKVLFVLRLRNKAEGYIFPGRSKEPITLNTITARFKTICGLAGLPQDLTLHDTRHTFASRMVNAGIEIPTIKAVGGWKSSKTLLDIYSHSDESKKRSALEQVIF